MRISPQNRPDVGEWGCGKATTLMVKMTEEIWIRKTSVVSCALSSIERFGPDPQITIPASGFRKCRIQRPYRRPHSITCTLDQKLLAPRAATTEDASSNWTLWAKTRSASIAAIALSTNFSAGAFIRRVPQIGRASGRERLGQYVLI